MNTDNNLENNIGSESLGGIQSPINSEPVNNVGDNNFIPFQDLNNSPLNVPTENLDSVGVQNPAPENNYFNQGVNSTPINNDAAISAPEPMVTDSYQTPTSNIDEFNSVMNPEPVSAQVAPQAAPAFDNFSSAPAENMYEPTPSNVDSSVNPNTNNLPNNVGINDFVTQNTTQIPTVDNSLNVGPTMPIPDSMPTTSYQAGVSTPVDYATPMNDFDQIGTNPELDPKSKGKKKSNKLAVVILLLILIGGLGYGSYYAINVLGILDSKSVSVKDVTSEKGEALSVNIDDYATFNNTSSSNCVLDTTKVNISTVGDYEYTITCGDKEYKGKITIKDTKGPEIVVKTNIVVAGTTLTADMLVESSDETATYAYASEAEKDAYQTAGLKMVKVVATDSNNNTKNYIIPVVVTSSEYSMGIVSKKDITGDNTDATIIEKNVILYNNSGGAVNDTSYTAYIIKFNSDVLYNEAVKNYDGSASLTYATFTGTPLFYKGSNTLVLIKDINSDLIKEDYTNTWNNLTTVGGYQAFLVNQMGINKELLEFSRI